MKSLMIGLLAGAMCAGSMFVGSPVDARMDDAFLEACEAYADENGVEINCSCLDAAAEEDPSLYEEFAKVATPADAQNMSEAAKQVVVQCAAE